MKQKAWSNWLNWIAGSFIILIFSSFIAGKGGFDWKKITETECCLAHAKYKERPHKGAKSCTLSSHISIPLEPRRVGINHPFLHHWYSSHDSLSMGLHAFGQAGVERKDTQCLLSKFTDPHSQTSQCIWNEGWWGGGGSRVLPVWCITSEVEWPTIYEVWCKFWRGLKNMSTQVMEELWRVGKGKCGWEF